ncbi:hypothetical protein [Herbidospora sp. RD11066]
MTIDLPEDPQAHYPLTSKEGWRTFVDEHPLPPALLSPSALQNLTEPQRADYYTTLEDYHAQLVIVSTPTVRHVTATGRQRILLNRHQRSARRGLIVSGVTRTGKTTAITQLGKNHEQLARRRGCRRSILPDQRHEAVHPPKRLLDSLSSSRLVRGAGSGSQSHAVGLRASRRGRPTS